MEAVGKSSLSEIGDYLSGFVPFLLEEWKNWKLTTGRPIDMGSALAENMCGFTSLFIAKILEARYGGRWFLDGGSPERGGGIVCAQGQYRGHYWVTSEDGIIVDMTAEQFGHPSIIVTSSRDRRYRSVFQPAELTAHHPRVNSVAEDWYEKAVEAGYIETEHNIGLKI